MPKKYDRCVKKVKSKGNSKRKSHAICQKSVMKRGGKKK